MGNINELEARLKKVEVRNRRVEADKAWETSLTRRLIITALTYLIVGLYLLLINNEQPWINAIVPAIGFLLSTLVVSFAKLLWLRQRQK